MSNQIWNDYKNEWINPPEDCPECEGTGVMTFIGTYSHLSHTVVCGECSGANRWQELAEAGAF